VYRCGHQLAYTLMTTLRPPRFSLATLRRSARLAAFALAVFVLRLGIVAGCEPNDLAELMSGHADLHVVDSALDASSDPAPDSPDEKLPGHCLHCSCHFPAALPAAPDAMTVAETLFVPPRPNYGQSDAPPGRQLRPPIA
jgi:hypothetical protein